MSSFPRDINSIIVDREDRQRRTLVNIEDLAASIARRGLINPIVIDEDGKLLAGERRLTACRALGWTQIECRTFSDLSDFEKQLLELDENIQREDLAWQDQVSTVNKIHSLYSTEYLDWTQEKTAEETGFSLRWVRQALLVASNMDKPEVSSADKFSVARGISERALARKKDSAVASVSKVLTEVAAERGIVTEEPPTRQPPLLHEDFSEWSATYSGPKFNMIHCDFPYGVGMHNSDQGAGAAFGTYADDPDIFWHLIATLTRSMENVVADSAHLIFWFSMDYYSRTKECLEVMGWKVDPFPLVWHKSDNTGIIPDARRGPRRIYETAFFGSRGDRLLATGSYGQGPVANCFAVGGSDKTLHMNEKPIAMLRHFMRMCVDEYSSVLDPTCGSANALKAAELLGAASVLGIERDENFFGRSWEAYYGEAN